MIYNRQKLYVYGEQDTSMKKKHAAFLLFGAIVLSSCANYGPEISDKTEIQELEKAISARMNEIKGYELVGTERSSSRETRGERWVNYITDAVYRIDQKGNQYLSVADDLDGTKYYQERYEVTDAKYGKVLYCEDPNDFDPDHYAAYILDDMKPVDSEGSLGFWTHGGNFVTPFIERFSQVRDPLNFDGSFFFWGKPTPPKYRSKGEGSLTIALEETYEDSYSTHHRYFRVTYDNYVLQSARLEDTGMDRWGRDDYSIEISFKALDSLSITLPKGWENKIQKYERK